MSLVLMPQLLATFFSHRLWTFMQQTEKNNWHINYKLNILHCKTGIFEIIL